MFKHPTRSRRYSISFRVFRQINQVIAWQLEQARTAAGTSKGALAKEMKTSRTQVDRALDPANVAVSWDTLARAAQSLGKRLEVRLVDAAA